MSTGPVGPAAVPSTVLDLTGLPTAVRTRALRWQALAAGGLAVSGGCHLLLGLPLGDVASVGRVVVGAVVVVLALLWLVRLRGARLVLEPEGVRAHDGFRPGALWPWADVIEVRPPTPTSPHAVLLLDEPGPGGHVDLLGVRPEVARELQRRLEAAQGRPGSGRSR